MTRPRDSDAIILLGLSPTASHEAQALRALGNQVILITTSEVPDQVRVGGRSFDLSDGRQLASFPESIGLPPLRAATVANAIGGAGPYIRDELGQLAMAWVHAERVGIIPGRMVISGEHVGEGMFWGKGRRGGLLISDIGALAVAFPRVANAIEDLHMSACNSAIEILAWPKIFPRLKTIWAYARSCPGGFMGASSHLTLWDRATRGRVKSIGRMIAKGTRKGDNVVLWTPLQGIVTGEVNSIEELRARVTAARATFESYFRGDDIVTDTGNGPLRDYYELLQAMLRHVDIRETERSTMAKRRDATIRLLFYDKSVKASFAREYRALIVAGYDALGMPAPDFSRLSRKQALASITAFEEKADVKPVEAAEKLRPYLVEGLVQLSDRYVPITWI